MCAKVKEIWLKISLQLPLMADKSIEDEMARLIDAVNKVMLTGHLAPPIWMKGLTKFLTLLNVIAYLNPIHVDI